MPTTKKRIIYKTYRVLLQIIIINNKNKRPKPIRKMGNWCKQSVHKRKPKWLQMYENC